MFWFDSIILAALFIGAGLGFWSGLLWQVARVISLALALYATVVCNDPASDLLTQHVMRSSDPRVVHGVAFGVVFCAVYLTLFLLTRLLQQTIRAAHLETADRLLGSLLGLGKMALLVAAVIAGMTALALPTTEDLLGKSLLAPYFTRGTEAGVAMIPDACRAQLTENLQIARDAVERKFAEHPELDLTKHVD